jgi:magnesium-protoporphyrin IX monomethyl ester (oxidative) cyclase
MSKKIERVTLAVPPLLMPTEEAVKRIAPPLGLAYLAAMIERDCRIDVFDSVMEGFEREERVRDLVKRVGLSDADIRERFARFKPDVIGISVGGTDQYSTAHRMAAIAREACPDAAVIMGGIYPTTQPEKALGDPNVDWIVLGEADTTFPALLRAIGSGATDPLPDGVGYKDTSGAAVIIPKKGFIDNIDSLPMPALHLLRMDLYNNVDRSYRFGPLRRPHTSMFTSRGCPAKCIFCGARHMMGRQYRAHSPKRVLDEIGRLIDTYGIREIAFLDDNLTWGRERAAAIFDGIIRRGFDLTWMTPNGIALYAVDEKLIEKMKASGCYSVYLAFESGCQDVLSKIIHKPLNVEKARRLSRKFNEAGIETTGMFVIGFPGETLEQIEETVQFAKDVGCDYVSFSIATPYPGTEMYEICAREGYFVDGFNDDSLVFGFGKGHVRTPDFTPEDILRFRKEAWRRINFDTDPARRKKVEEWLKR